VVNEPSISVIIPVYNSAPKIGRALDSILEQTHPVAEIVVVDDGSSDDLEAALEPYGDRVRLLRKAHGGAASARNFGIDQARGDLLAFLDADDYWEPAKLARQMEALEQHPEVGLVASLSYEQYPHDERRLPEANGSVTLGQVLKPADQRALAMSTRIRLSTVLLRRSALGCHRFDPGLPTAEDCDLFLRLIAGCPIYLDSQPLATSVIQPEALSRTDVDFHCNNLLRVVNRYSGLLGPDGQRAWEAQAYRAWAKAALETNRPRRALVPAVRRLARQPLAVESWRTLLKATLLAYLPASVVKRRLANRVQVQAGRAAPATGVQKKVIARNVVWNWAGIIVPMAAGFLLAPFLIGRLGETGYGLWVLLASFTSYFGMLDLGVRSSVGRYIAFYHARNDRRGINATLSTALALLGCAAVLALLATGGALIGFFHLFAVPPEQADAVWWALLLVGINLALSLPLNVFDATLWAGQRFDLLNAIDIPVVVVRTGLAMLLVGAGGSLVALAWVTLAATLTAASAKAICSFRLDRQLRVQPRLVSRGMARTLLGYGIWYFLLSVARVITPQISPLVIGNRLSVAWVTPYNVAGRMTSYAQSALVASTGVLTPVATALHARSQEAEQRQLFLEGGKYCLALVLFFVLVFVLLGRSLITLWVGPELAVSATPVLLVLALGELLPMSQWVTNSLILGKERHRLVALAGVVENVTAVALALGLVGRYGIVGVAVAVAVPGTLCRGLLHWVYGCRLLGVGLGEYVRRVVVPPVLTAAVPAVALALVTNWRQPESWGMLLLYGGAYALVYLAFGVFLTDYGPRQVVPLASFRQFYLAAPPD
jgi:O-antigen/teichoic acid export membrane protein/glycosyltransferase involved in cell wall biosynthesis